MYQQFLCLPRGGGWIFFEDFGYFCRDVGRGKAASSEILLLGQARQGPGLSVGAEVDGVLGMVDNGVGPALGVRVDADDRFEDGGIHGVPGASGRGDDNRSVFMGTPARQRKGGSVRLPPNAEA